MADELDRVRISAAELRAGASNLINHEESLRDGRDERRSQRQREGKRPDLQRYQPTPGHTHRQRDGGEAAKQAPQKPDQPETAGDSPPASDAKMEADAKAQQGSADTGVRDADCCQDASRGNCLAAVPKGLGADRGQLSGGGCGGSANPRAPKAGADLGGRHDSLHRARNDSSGSSGQQQDCPDPIANASVGVSQSPKPARRVRKPDREIYQPGGRRSQHQQQGARDTASGKEEPKKVSQAFKDDGEREDPGGGKQREDRTRVKDGKEAEAKKPGQKAEQGKGKREPCDAPAAQESSTAAENLSGRVERLSISAPAGGEAEGKRGGGGGEEAGGRRRKAGMEGKRNRAGGGGAQGGEENAEKAERKGRGGRKNRGGEREADREPKRRSGGGERARAAGERETAEQEDERERDRERARDAGGIRDRERERETPKDRDRPKERDGDRDRPKERDGDRYRVRNRPGETEQAQEARGRPQLGSKASLASKRYSKSDKRRPRTYSTSSASSGTSMDGPADRGPGGKGVGSWPGSSGKDRGERREDWGRGPQPQQNRRAVRDFSSTDSLEECETGRQGGRRRAASERDRFGEEDWSPDRRPREGRAHRGGPGPKNAVGGILRVSFDKPSAASHESSDDPHRRAEAGPRGRGRGILILPAHTNITASPEPGPRLLVGGARGGVGQGRARGGRGGALRRLWDPNNPDQKPALTRGQQFQQSPHLQQGGYGQLHFLDTDDEAAGSPPVRQGDPFQNFPGSQQAVAMNAAAMAFYKFQNSDNPYCYPMASNASSRYPYPYHLPYQIPSTNGIYPGPATASYYAGFGQAPGSQGYPPATSPLTPEEMEVQARSELVKLLRVADSQELQLSNLLSRDRLSPEGLDRMTHLRAELLSLYERVILTDIEFSDSQNLDQALWKNVFYQVIERFRQLLKDPAADTAPRIRNMLLTLLDEGAVFFDALLQKLQTVFHFKLEDYMDGLAIRARPLRKTVKYALISAQRCMICQGDIARYREQASDSANYGKARSWYLKAQQIAPKNGRPYNQLALLAVYTKRKLDAVYYYMRSLAASNPILTAKESLMSLFEETKRKVEQLDRRQQRDSEGGSRGPRSGTGRGEEAARVEIWIRPSGPTGNASRTGSESGRDSEQDGELGALSASDLNKRFILSLLHAHGKLFTRVGMETFPEVAGRVLQEFRALLQHSPSPLGSTRMLQIVTINMFAVHNAQSRDGPGEARSVQQEQTTALGLAMFGLLVRRCTELLKDTPTAPPPLEEAEEGEEGEAEGMVRVSSFPADLRELLPSVKVWSDWMLGHPEQWNPPPCGLPSPAGSSPDVWQCLADLCNALACVYHGEAPLYKADGDEDLRLLLLEEDRLLAGFVPLLAAPQEPCYIDATANTAIAADCKRVTVLKYFLEALCGQEEPLLAFKGGKYVSVATLPPPGLGTEAGSHRGKQADNQDDDVIVEAESSQSECDAEPEGGASGSEDDIRELRARRHALTHELAQQQRRRDKIQAVLQTCRQLELEIRPLFLVPDTNGFIDHLAGLRKLMTCGLYILVVPLIVITELDGLAKGQDNRGGAGGAGGSSGAHARGVQERAKAAVGFLEQAFEAREPCLRALTSRGNQLESIAFRSEDTSGQQGNNDDLILSCCLNYCKDKAKDFMPTQRDEPVRLHREVVLLTDDRNLRVKALTRNVPVRDIPAFLSWAKVG
ncbi:telomerase-binding protein EST1A isoform X2 [Anguilla rostrata]|uniref:telomerase-binding protein EST1A isoform X2 n=1 Tax=Anguilla rostrata TaxID=7938 RepID=UPI0030D1F6A0